MSGLNVTLPPLNTQGGNMAFFDAVSDDGWASTPTVDSLLPKIVALWDELYVPLAYRSRRLSPVSRQLLALGLTRRQPLSRNRQRCPRQIQSQ